MKYIPLTLWWQAYKKYISGVILPPGAEEADHIDYWQDKTFARLLIYMAPIGLLALIPCVYISFSMGFNVIGVADLLVFALLIVIMCRRSMKIASRKIIFLCLFYVLSLILLFFLITSGVGMLYLLAMTIITGIIYSPRIAYYAAFANAVICIAFALLYRFDPASPHNNGYTTGAWIAVSSNLVILSFICVKCLTLLLNGLDTTIAKKSTAEKRLLLATQSAGMGIWDWDIPGDTLSWDAGMRRLYNIDGFGSIYDAWHSMIHPEDQARTHNDILMAIEGEKDYDTEFRIIWSDQTIHHIRATARIERDVSGMALRMIGANWDITAQKNDEEKLSISKANLKAIIENSEANIYSLDTDFRYITFNDVLKTSLKQAYGVDVQVGDRAFEFLEKLAPDEAREWQRIYTKALTGQTLKFEKEFRTENFASTTAFTINPIIDRGKISGLSCFAYDITEIKKARQEILTLNENLERKVAERTAELENANKELEAFSYSVSHDLKAPVRTMIGFVHLIKTDHADQLHEDAKEMFGYIERSSQRMNTIIDDLLLLAKFGKEKMVVAEVDLMPLFHDVWDNLLFTSPHSMVMELHPMPVVMADRSMMEQVIVNILSNAIKYSSKKPNPKVVIGFSRTETCYTIHVSDNGAGFDMKHYDRLFGAFQRLHGSSEFEGTGVGLMLTKKIIERHGGTVWADGRVGEGATFHFTLPAGHKGIYDSKNKSICAD